MIKKQPFHLLLMEGIPIYEQLRIEEAILRADDKNWCLINSGSPPAIVMGISGKAHELVGDGAREQNLPLIRRFSGGGTVVVDENTEFVSFIGHSGLLGGSCFPETVHRFAESLYKSVFQDGDFSLRENDYVFGDKKFGGNAQYFRKERWLHHTTFLWDWSQERMQSLLIPPKMPVYREKRGHSEFLCRLSERYPSREGLKKALIAALQDRFFVEEISLEQAREYLELPHRKATKQEPY